MLDWDHEFTIDLELCFLAKETCIRKFFSMTPGLRLRLRGYRGFYRGLGVSPLARGNSVQH
jgi:hypothetical protein